MMHESRQLKSITRGPCLAAVAVMVAGLACQGADNDGRAGVWRSTVGFVAPADRPDDVLVASPGENSASETLLVRLSGDTGTIASKFELADTGFTCIVEYQVNLVSDDRGAWVATQGMALNDDRCADSLAGHDVDGALITESDRMLIVRRPGPSDDDVHVTLAAPANGFRHHDFYM